MRNAIIFKVDLDGGDKPLSATKLVATFTLTASHKNTQDLLLSDGKTDPIDVAPGTLGGGRQVVQVAGRQPLVQRTGAAVDETKGADEEDQHAQRELGSQTASLHPESSWRLLLVATQVARSR